VRRVLQALRGAQQTVAAFAHGACLRQDFRIARRRGSWCTGLFGWTVLRLCSPSERETGDQQPSSARHAYFDSARRRLFPA